MVQPDRSELTPKQKDLAIALLKTRTEAKVNRRHRNPIGNFVFYTITRPTSPIDFPVNDEEFVLKLHEREPEAPLSPIYINLRGLPGDLLTQVAETIAETLGDARPNFCVGIPEAGTPIAEEFTKSTGIPELRILDKGTSLTGRQIVPAPFSQRGEGRSILLVDDLVTQADTKLEAAKAVEELGFRVFGVAVLIDREQGGATQLANKGYRLFAALKLTEVLRFYVQFGLITVQRYNQAMSYLAENK